MVQLTGARSRDGELIKPLSGEPHRADDLSDHPHRQLIGYIGLLLPFLLILMVVARDGTARWKELGSISAYYYTGGAAAFVGMLVALALFLFTYRGYKNKYHWADRGAGITAAIAALGVAVFPTEAPPNVTPLSWWLPITGVIHYVCAVVLFVMFAVYALWLFRMTPADEQVTSDKKRRNMVYLVCGLVILVSIAWAGFAGMEKRSIFVPESIALIAFAVSWLVKGYATTTLGNAIRRVLGGHQAESSAKD